jgi:hypothetical protein
MPTPVQGSYHPRHIPRVPTPVLQLVVLECPERNVKQSQFTSREMRAAAFDRRTEMEEAIYEREP